MPQQWGSRRAWKARYGSRQQTRSSSTQNHALAGVVKWVGKAGPNSRRESAELVMKKSATTVYHTLAISTAVRGGVAADG